MTGSFWSAGYHVVCMFQVAFNIKFCFWIDCLPTKSVYSCGPLLAIVDTGNRMWNGWHELHQCPFYLIICCLFRIYICFATICTRIPQLVNSIVCQLCNTLASTSGLANIGTLLIMMVLQNHNLQIQVRTPATRTIKSQAVLPTHAAHEPPQSTLLCAQNCLCYWCVWCFPLESLIRESGP